MSSDLDRLMEKEEQSKKYWEMMNLTDEWKADFARDFVHVNNYQKSQISFSLDDAITEKALAITKHNDFPLFSIFMACLQIELYKYNGKTKNIIGIPIFVSHKENRSGINNKVLPFFTNFNSNAIIKNLILQNRNKLIETYQHSHINLENLLRNSNISNSVMELTPISLTMNTLHLDEHIQYIHNSNNNEITISIEKTGKGIVLSFVYNATLFTSETIHQFGKRFLIILTEMMVDLAKEVKDVEMITSEEKHQILKQFNLTKTKYPADKTIQVMFEEEAQKNPNKIAVVYKQQSLTYQELNEKSNQMAWLLQERGVKVDSVAAIMGERSIEMIIGILGILKSGGTYLPIDPSYPKERINFMLKDAEVDVLLIRNTITQELEVNIPELNVNDPSIEMKPKTNLETISHMEDFAYIIYTSGSTGNPKGVPIKHKSVINLCTWFGETYNLRERRHVMHNTSISFDVSVEEVFGALLNGGTVYITTYEESTNRYKFRQFIQKHDINIVQLVPTTIQEFIVGDPKLESVDVLISGGEALPNTLKNEVIDLGYDIYNCYGPTETTVDALTTLCGKDKSNVIGKPIANTRVYITNRDSQLQPIGLPGELYISGEGLSIGYLNRSELTEEKFVANLFETKSKMYKTGDLVKWLPDGSIEFIGRLDHQVKIRGFRIELGEIENKLSEQPFILQSVVLAWENDNQGKYLCAYLLGEESIDIAALRNNLKKELPHYMVPTYFIQVESIPLTPNGKVDRKILPKPDTLDLSIQEYVAPSNVKEKRLVEVCSEILGVKKIGIHEDFFDLGGDSIKAIRLISKLQKFGFTLEVKDIFDNSNLKAISLKMTEEQVVVDQKTVSGDVLLTPIQRMFFEKDITDVHHWNQAIMLYGRDGFRVEWIEKIFDKITCHHDALRMVYRKHNGKVKQINRDIESNLFSIDVHDLRKYDHYEGLISLKCNELQSSIDLENGPLVKLGIFQTKEGDYLLIAIHHLVIDGVSWRILLEDFTEGYNLLLKGKKVDFQPKSNSYQEWADFLQEKLEYFQQELPYWNKMEQQHIKPLPTDFEFQEFENKQKNAREVHVELNQSYTEDLLKRSNQAYNTEINDLLLAALTRTIYQWTNEKNILINLEGHGRDAFEGNININRTIGWFTAQYPLLLKMEDKSTSSLIKHTKESLRKVPNKGIGYGILKYLSPSKPWNNREPEISFNYLGQFDEQLNDELFEISSLYSGETVSPNSDRINEIDINGMITNQKLSFSVSYNSLRYRTETIRKFLERFKGNLIEIIHHCLEKDVMEYTVSDYSDEDLTTDELKNLKEAYEVANKTQITNIYPLSPMQEGMLFHSLVQSESSAYFDQTIFTAKGIVDMELVQKSFQILINKYDILRTVIAYKDVEKPRQVVLKERKPMVYFHDLSSMDNKQLDDRIEKIILEDRKQGFNLSKDVLMRLFILKQGNKEYKVIWSSHHILMDGWSTWILLKDFFDIYSMLKNNNILEMDNPKQYGHYIDWLQKQNRNHAKQYWYQYLEGYETNVKIPSIRTHHYEYMVEDLDFVLNKDITNALTNIAKSSKTTLNTIIQVVWGILLQQYNQTNDVVFGSVVSGRNYDIESLEEMVGLFINMIPVRITSNPKQIFIDLLKETQNKALESSKYDYYPLADIQSLTDIKSDLITSKITFQNYYIDEALVNFDFVSELGFTVEDIHGYEQTNYDFNIKVIPSEDTKITFSYNKNVHDSETVINLKNHFIEIIQSVIQNQEIAVSQISMTTDTERKEILHGFNDTSVTYPKDKTISQLWEEQVEKHPHHIAVECEGKQLTYQALNEKANQLARTLRQNGITANAIVGMMIDGSLEMMVGMIGILKAGGAYLPIDSTHPIDRINYMIEDAKLDVLVTTSSYANKTAFAGMIVNLADSSAYQADSTNLDINHESRDLAYVMYTSGTTGKAKGVMVSHANVINYTVAMIQKINLTSTDETALLSSYAFDLGYTTIYTALLSGTTLHIASESTYKDPNKLVSFIGKHCTYVKMTPSLFSVMMQSDELDTFLQTGKLRLLILGGESLNRNDLTHFFAKDTENKICFMNHYGPTETTIGCVATEINRQEMIEHGVMNVIGKPLANVKAYMLDPQQNLCPIGVKGELYVSGAGVAQGYLYNPELTEVKFLDNPFEPGERMYRTGDLARFLPDGRIEFLGRIDNQVKIRGYRVELGEIEHQLRKQPLVSEATVFVKDEAGEKLLVAYFVGEQELDIASIRDGMKEGLPHYMIPTYFVQVEKMPLTRNGKLNKYALPEPAEQHLVTNDYVAPRTSIEQTLAAIWSEVLGIDKVGIHDNFFDLGGHSLKATALISKIHKQFKVEISLREFLESPTINLLSTYIGNGNRSVYELIEPYEKSDFYEASSAQKRMYMLQQYETGTLYNMPLICEIEGSIDPEKIQKSLQQLVSRHDSLRTFFDTVEGEIVQKVLPKANFKLERRFVAETVVNNLLKDFVKTFNLSKAPLFRAELVMSNNKNYLLTDMHHIISDGISLQILINEFMALYNGERLNSLKLQYKDFAVWQNKFWDSIEMKRQEDYWLEQFNGEIPILNLPYDFERPPIQSFEGETLTYYMDKKLALAVRKMAKDTGSTMNMVLLAAFHLLLAKYSGQDDIVIGTPIAGRPHDDLENMIGMFVNTLALRNRASGNISFEQFLNAVKQNALQSYENQSYQFEELIKKVQVERDTSRHSIFDVMFSMNYAGFDKEFISEDFVLTPIHVESNISKFDLTLTVYDNETMLKYTMEYCTKLFKKETIDRMASHYKEILTKVCTQPTTILSEINILTEYEQHQLLQEFNQTNADYPKDKSVHTLFEEQAEKNPHHIAVVCADQKVTYQELNKKANQLARVLRQQGVQNEAIVGLIMDRSIDMIIGIMGILKAGGAYLPIDPTHPTDRIQTILSDAKVSLVVTSSGQARSLSLAVQAIDITVEGFYQGLSTNLDLAIDCHQLAYVIYTSGSTGTPKGVMVEHQQVTNFIYGVMRETNLGSYERILCLTTVSFDIFGLETFVPLTQGLTVVMAKEEETREGEKLATVMTKHQVDVMQSTPTRVKMLLENDSFTDALTRIKALLVGGEELPKSLWKELQGYPFTVFNMYGPTETTIWSTVKKLESTDRITIGKPIQNTELYLMDSNRKLVPIGVHGELCIGGDGVARGYFNREALTKERFIDHPFKPGERLYKTGDLARWLPNGELEYLGRMDNQVKVRGYRIELGEIESRLISHPAIKEAVVVAREDEMNQKYLCAYIVAKDFVDKAEVRTYVKEGLPDYMVPAYYMELQTIPLTHNGKVNRKALPKPEMQYITNAYEAPQTTTQKKLVIIWQHVLGVDAIGIHDNFFDLGGHSLKATMVMGEIHKALEISVPLKEIFNRPTIQELSNYIETEGLINPYEQIEPCEEKEYYQTSSAQKRMYTVQQLDQESTAYNMPAIFELEGDVNRERMEATFRQLIERHEVLRTSYKMVEGEITQKIMSHLDFHLPVRTVDETDKTVLVQNFIRPFSLEEAPLFRAEIMKSQGTDYLLIDMHHIISDGVSMSILVQEFAKLYNGDKLAPLRIQYKDYAEWEQHYLQSGQMKKQARYWKEQFQDEVPVLQLPYDFERPAFQRFEGDSISFTIDGATTKQLQELAKQEDVTMHMVLLSTFTIQLARYSGQEDIVVGVPIAGRPHADLQNIMGVFVNTLAMRHRPNKHKTFSEFLKEVKENSLQAYDNQNYQLEELIKEIDVKRNPGRNPLFDVLFDMTNIDISTDRIDLDHLQIKQKAISNTISKFDISLKVLEISNTIQMSFEYSIALFKKEFMERAIKDFKVILEAVLNSGKSKIEHINVLNHEEKRNIEEIDNEVKKLRSTTFTF
ncbi:amino acid adenylation domain-containing protein [Virgibacillus salarius]|uniref:amino acid adenylation domain-containing protein n=1 Tax=Virgibacillus salarius TaxID=447199 RepID=UPI0031DE2B68